MENLKIGDDLLELNTIVRVMETSPSYHQLLDNWKRFARNLGVKESTILQLSNKLSIGTTGLLDIPHELLGNWKADKGKGGTLKALYGALVQTGIKDIADALELKYWLQAIKTLKIKLQTDIVMLGDIFRESVSVKIYQRIYNEFKRSTCAQPIRLLNIVVDPQLEIKYYIPRTLSHKNQIDSAIFQAEITNEHFFLVKGIKKHELADVCGYQLIGLSGSRPFDKTIRFRIFEKDDHWDNICQETTDPVHLLKYEDGSYFWMKSNNAQQVIYQFLKANQKVYQEDEFVDLASKILPPRSFCISDSPGMGKTFLLESLASKFKSKNKTIVMFIVLNEILRQSKTTQSPSSAFDAILKYSCANNVSKLILEAMMSNSTTKVDLFLDGYDEVKQDKLEDADIFLNHVKGLNNVRMFLTTRPHLRRRAENVLKVISCEILPFDRINQVQFLSKYWVHKHGGIEGEQLEVFAQKCLKTLHQQMTDHEWGIAGIPLQCRMLAEVYAEKAEDACNPNFNAADAINITSLFDMYKRLVELKLGNIPAECNNFLSVVVKMNWFKENIKTNYINAHIHDSILLFFPERMNEFKPHLKGFQRINMNTLYSIGLIEMSPYSNSPRFVHRTFAEYILAEFLVQKLDQLGGSYQIIFENVLGGKGVELKTPEDSPMEHSLKHSTIAYFINMHLKTKIQHNPIDQLSLRIFSFQDRIIRFENVCQAMAACGNQDLHGILFLCDAD